MPVKDSNTRVQVTFTRKQVETMKAKADTLGVSLSQYINLMLRSAGVFDGGA